MNKLIQWQRENKEVLLLTALIWTVTSGAILLGDYINETKREAQKQRVTLERSLENEH